MDDDHIYSDDGISGAEYVDRPGLTKLLAHLKEFDVIVTPIGTGGTFAGLLKGSLPSQKVIGISSLKGAFIHREIEDLLAEHHISKRNFQLIDSYHAGGYGKVTTELIDFVNWFKEKFGVPLDPVYTGKSFFGNNCEGLVWW